MNRWNVIALSAFLAAVPAGALAYEETTETRLKVETQRAAPAPQPPTEASSNSTRRSRRPSSTRTVGSRSRRPTSSAPSGSSRLPPPAPPVVEKKSVEVYRETRLAASD
jgi:hypothetical protein